MFTPTNMKAHATECHPSMAGQESVTQRSAKYG